MLLHSGISISSPNTGHKDKLCFSPNTGHKDKLCFSLNTGHILNKGAVLSSVHCCVDIFGEDGILIFFHLQVSTYAFRAELYLFDTLEWKRAKLYRWRLLCVWKIWHLLWLRLIPLFTVSLGYNHSKGGQIHISTQDLSRNSYILGKKGGRGVGVWEKNNLSISECT